MIPIIYCTLFNYATGDDLWEGSSLRRVIVAGGSFADAWAAFSDRFRMDYFGWEGNWSSIILWCIEPSIWGRNFISFQPI